MSATEWWAIAVVGLVAIMFFHEMRCDRERKRLHDLLEAKLTAIEKRIEGECVARRDVTDKHLQKLDRIVELLSFWKRLQERPDEGHQRNI